MPILNQESVKNFLADWHKDNSLIKTDSRHNQEQ